MLYEIISLRICSKSRCWQIDIKRASIDVIAIYTTVSTITASITIINTLIIIIWNLCYWRFYYSYNCWSFSNCSYSHYLDDCIFIIVVEAAAFENPLWGIPRYANFLLIVTNMVVYIRNSLNRIFEFLPKYSGECQLHLDQYL